MKLLANRFGGTWVYAYIFPILVLFLPFCIIYGFPFSEWLDRLIAYGLFISTTQIAILWWSLHPNVNRIPHDAKAGKNRAGKESAAKSDVLVRIIGTLFGLFFLFALTIPYCRDLIDITNGNLPTRIKGRVTSNHTYFGMWFLHQSIKIDTPQPENFTLLYSLEPRIQKGDQVSFSALRYSGFIVTAVRSAD